MNEKFYAGHNMNWMQQFLDAVPNKKRTSKSIGFSLACCIHHQYVYKKKNIFKINHNSLQYFGVKRKSLKTYLEYFKQARLINYTIKNGKIPTIELLLIPTNYLLINKQLKTTNIYHTGGIKRTGTCTLKDRLPVLKRTGLKLEPSNQPRKEGTNQATKEGREEGKKNG